MKKINSVILSCLLILIALCSCGASKNSDYAATEMLGEKSYGYYSEEAAYDSYEGYDGENGVQPANPSPSGKSDYQAIEDASARKLIKDASLDIHTEAYDEFNTKLREKIKECGGYIENSSESGSSYNYSSYRSGSITARIPSDKLDSFLGDVSSLAVITSQSVSVRDITGDYIDTESRIKALETERDALLGILSKADNVADLITVQERLTKVNADIQSSKARLKTYDELISYSKVEMDITEVSRATGTDNLSFGRQIITRLSDNLYNIGQGVKNFSIWFISSIPYFLIIAAVIIVTVIIIKKIVKRGKKRRNALKNKADTSQNKTED